MTLQRIKDFVGRVKLDRLVFVILGIVFAVLVEDYVYAPIVERLHRPDVYEVIVIGDAETAGWGDEVWQGVRSAYRCEESDEEVSTQRKQATCTVDLEEYKIRFQLVDDDGDPGFGKEQAQRLAEQSNLIAAIGHSTSSVTLQAASVYKDHGIPLIMPTATNPQLTQVNRGEDDPAILFRLVPTDREQAAVAAWLVRDVLQTSKIAILRDGSNPKYSDYLAGEFRRWVQDGWESGDHATVLLDAIVGKDSEGVFLSKFLLDMKPDVIYFVGNGEEGRTLIHQYSILGAPHGWEPKFIVTDSCVGEDFLNEVLKHKESLGDNRIFATLPFQAPSGEGNGGMTFGPYGEMAARLVVTAIEKAEHRSRRGVVEFLRAEQDYEDIGDLDFDVDGENIKAKFQVWTVGPHGWKHKLEPPSLDQLRQAAQGELSSVHGGQILTAQRSHSSRGD